jgi:DNA ligase N terminus
MERLVVVKTEFHFTKGGLRWPTLGLWMDPHESAGPNLAGVVSHAHSDHTAAHAVAVGTAATLDLMCTRIGGSGKNIVLDFGRSVPVQDLVEKSVRLDASLTLLPAGHILGSAMCFLKLGGESLLYTGDFKLEASRTAEACAPCHADVLVMETTFGRPEYRFPSPSQTFEGVAEFCRDALDNGQTPVLLAYSLGKAQEAHAHLQACGFEFALHPAVARMTAVYVAHGVRLGGWSEWRAGPAPGKVIITPPGSALNKIAGEVGPIRTAVLTGWAMDPACRHQSRTDAAFPVSDHADFDGLVDFVRRVSPRKIYTLHGFSADFSVHLRSLGFDAEPVEPDRQLELALPLASARRLPRPEMRMVLSMPFRSDWVVPGRPYERFASFAERIRSEPNRDRKRSQLANFLEAAGPEVSASEFQWLIGFATHSTPSAKTVRFIESSIADAVGRAAQTSSEAVRNAWVTTNDWGLAAAKLWSGRLGGKATIPEVEGVRAGLEVCDRGIVPRLAWLLSRAGEAEVRTMVGVMRGDLRIGLPSAEVLEVAAAFPAFNPSTSAKANVQPVQEAFPFRGGIPES